ncbi:nicotinamide-nucleotide amidase [Ruminococcus flavefaciens]|uniref:Nicotinamide-nucleotide amidase n=1 Tax=Ruminococcus flavefaciens TaxID=1265 RepID=A0A1H6I4F6_RUMFL|nr:CinA family protein [Ruminococcus flavefaciens]SEH41140.1 nicotinamide-nucleotide amidase [Ruminococcus flavefaciens]
MNLVVSSKFSECNTEKLDKTVESVVKLLERKGLKIATAESCTGGLLSELITSVSGASAVFELGICTYSERIKTEFLNVPAEVIKDFGVVSEQTALYMVRGLKKSSGADVCVSVTGIAGPSGGTAETPVGTVYVGFDICGRQFVRLPELWKLSDMSREHIRKCTAAFAFDTIEKVLMEAETD